MSKNEEAKKKCLEIAYKQEYDFKKFSKRIVIYYKGKQILSAYA